MPIDNPGNVTTRLAPSVFTLHDVVWNDAVGAPNFGRRARRAQRPVGYQRIGVLRLAAAAAPRPLAAC